MIVSKEGLQGASYLVVFEEMVGLVGYTKICSMSNESSINDMVKSITTSDQQKVQFFTHQFYDLALVTLPTSHFQSFAYNEDDSIQVIFYGNF